MKTPGPKIKPPYFKVGALVVDVYISSVAGRKERKFTDGRKRTCWLYEVECSNCGGISQETQDNLVTFAREKRPICPKCRPRRASPTFKATPGHKRNVVDVPVEAEAPPGVSKMPPGWVPFEPRIHYGAATRKALAKIERNNDKAEKAGDNPRRGEELESSSRCTAGTRG